MRLIDNSIIEINIQEVDFMTRFDPGHQITLSDSKLYKDKNWLTEQHWNNKSSLRAMAKLAGCSIATIYQQMKKNNISIRSKSESQELKHSRNIQLYKDKNWLTEQHWVFNLSQNEMAKLIGCNQNTIGRWMNKNNILVRSTSESLKLRHDKNIQVYKDKNWLLEQYWGFDLSSTEIAKLAGCDRAVIYDWINKYGIPHKHDCIMVLERNELGQKYCNCCNRWLETNSFHKDKSKIDGLRPLCKNCRHDYRQTPEQQLKGRMAKSKRREMGYIELWPNPFPEDIDVEFHHVFQGMSFAIPVPTVTHNFVGGTRSDDAHWSYNKQWINELYQLDIDSLILDEGGCVLSC